MTYTDTISIRTAGFSDMIDITIQQIVFIDFDNRGRERSIIVQILGG